MKNKDFVKISVEEAFEILSENQDFRDYIDDHGMIFVDGCFVKADEKFIEKMSDGLHLTNYAKKHMADCAVNIRKNSFIEYSARLILNYLKSFLRICMRALKISLSALFVMGIIVALLGLISFAYNYIGHTAISAVIAMIVFLLLGSQNAGRYEDEDEDRGHYKRHKRYLEPRSSTHYNEDAYEEDYEEDYDYDNCEEAFPRKVHRSILDFITGSANDIFSSGNLDSRLLFLNPKYQSTLRMHLSDEQRKGTRSQLYGITPEDIYASASNFLENHNLTRQFNRLLFDPTESLSDCLWFIMQEKDWKTSETFWYQTLLHRNYFSKIKNDKFNNVKRETLMAVCVGLGLTLRMVEKVFRKAGLMLQEYEEPDQTYITILEYFPGISIDNFNSILESKGFKPLGTPIKE